MQQTLSSSGRTSANQLSANEALLAIHRSLSITHDKVVGELKKSVFANYETLADIALLAEELETALDEISRTSIKFEETAAAPASVLPTSPPVSPKNKEPVEEEAVSQKDPEVEALKTRLAGPFLDLIDSTKTRIIKHGTGLAELHGSIEALQSRPLYTIILSDSVIFCRQEAPSGSRSPKKIIGTLFGRSSSPTKRIEDKLQIEKYLPFQATTLFDIADSKHVQNCIKLKSTAVPDLGTRAESVLLNAGSEKSAWMDAFKAVIDQFRSASKSAASRPHIEPIKPVVPMKSEKIEVQARQGKATRMLIEQLFDELARAREVCAYDAAIEVIDKLNYQLQEQPSPEFKLRLADQVQLLVRYLLHEVSLPIVSRVRLVWCIRNLLVLQNADSARDCFFGARSNLIESRLNAIAFDGNALRLTTNTAATAIGIIKQTVALFLEAFKEDALLPGLILWIRVEIASMLGHCKHLLASSDNEARLKAISMLNDQLGQLNALGMDFVYLVRQFFAQ